MGYGILEVGRGSGHREKALLAMGVLKLDKFASHYDRLLKIHEGVSALIRRYKPSALAIEAPFYGKNVQSMLKLGRGQGAAIIAAKSAGIPVAEYAPSTIKKAITGRGNASKEQVKLFLQKELQIPESAFLEALDATDAVAVALCHHLTPLFGTFSPGGKRTRPSASWTDFAKQNPDKIKR
ncbi:MAG: crossover junction endodeoxyribonuclease RuvC [Bacteroidales bacterium]|nr:crossover junction endodeoxyribonuclease RuvC [Bacteroidales bacterium]